MNQNYQAPQTPGSAPPTTYTATIPTSQIKWRMSQMHAAGVPFEHSIQGPQAVISVPAEFAPAADAAMNAQTATRKPRRKVTPWNVRWSVLFVLLGAGVLPIEPIMGVVTIILAMGAMPLEGNQREKIRDLEAQQRAQGVALGIDQHLMTGGMFLLTVVLAATVVALFAITYFGVDGMTADGHQMADSVIEWLSR